MEQGFLTGMIHGALLGGAALVALSLAAPQPKIGFPRFPAVASTKAPMPNKPADPLAEVAPSAPSAAVDTAVDSARPKAPALDLPVGSEFARGDDIIPSLPAPMQAPTGQGGEAQAPVAPAAEPAPIAATGPDSRPEAVTPADMVATAPLAGKAEDAPMLPAPATVPVSTPALPAIGGVTQPDPAPAALTSGDAAPVNPSAAATPTVSAAPQTPPSLALPQIDLTTPPDLNDLRGLESD